MSDEIMGKPGPDIEFGHAPNFCPHCGMKRADDDTRWYTREGDELCSECDECGCHYGVQGRYVIEDGDDPGDDDEPAEFDFSKAKRDGRFVGWGKDGYSYPCDPCRHTGRVRVCAACGRGACWRGEDLCRNARSTGATMADCPKCGGKGRIEVSAEQARADIASHPANVGKDACTAIIGCTLPDRHDGLCVEPPEAKPMNLVVDLDWATRTCPCGASICSRHESEAAWEQFVADHYDHSDGTEIEHCSDDGARVFSERPADRRRELRRPQPPSEPHGSDVGRR